MNARVVLAALGLIGVAAAVSTGVTAQESGALRRDIERRFDVLPLRDGLALRPKSDMRGVRSIELTDMTIAIDGVPVTGAELRDRLGSEADPIIRLSYLDQSARRSLLGLAGTGDGRLPEAARLPAPQRTRRAESRVRLGGSVVIGEDEIIDGDVVAIGGSVTVDGQVTGNVVAIGGAVNLGSRADIAQDVVVVGGSLHRAEGARIGGRVNEIGAGTIDLSGLRLRGLPFRGWRGGRSFGSLFALTSTITRFVVLSVLVSVVMFLGRDYVERVGARAAQEPIKAGLVGVILQLLFVPLLIVTIVALVVTIVGIPLLALIPFAFLALAVVLLVGFSAVAHDLGRFVTTRFGRSTQSPYATAIVGIVVLFSPILLGRLVGLAGGVLFPFALALLGVGFLLEYLAWTVGFGAVALLRFDKTARP
jgi:hypothetical protein